VQHGGQRLELVAAVDAPGRIVRRVDDDEPRARADRRLDGGEIEIEAGRLQFELARHRIGGEQHRLVAEPGRLAEHRLVAGVEREPERHHDGREGAVGERDIGRLEGQAQLGAHALGQVGLRLGFASLVGEPVLVVRHRPLAQRRHDAGQRQLVRIAEGEIADAGLEPPLAVTRGQIEILHGGKRRVRRPHPRRNDRHGLRSAHAPICALGVEREMAISSSVMSAGMSANKGVLR
jgi:hypothetical protein